MRPEYVPIVCWVDAVIVMLILFGIKRGRARGMSEEVLDFLKWLISLVVASYLYFPLGTLLADQTGLVSRLHGCLGVYLAVLLTVRISFSILRQQLGDRLLTSDLFGDGEYFLGMVTGAARYACIVLVLLSLFHARYYTQEEIRAQIAAQQGIFGSVPFPTIGAVQREVFEDSRIGSMVRQYLPMLLIQATATEGNRQMQASTNFAPERGGDMFYQVLENR